VARFVQGTAAPGVVCVTPNPTGAQTCVDNTPFSFETLTLKGEATYRLGGGFSLTGGAEHRNQDRNQPAGQVGTTGVDVQRVVPLRTEIEETTLRAELRRSLSETLNGALSYLWSDRDGSAYAAAGAGPGGAPSDLINPIHIADRERNKWRAALDWTPTTALSLQLVFEDSSDRYGFDATRRYGLRDGDATLYSIDTSYNLSSNWQVNAWYSHDTTEATQFNRRDANSNAGLADLESRLKDTGDSIGVGLRGKPTSKLNIGADLQWTRNESKYPQTVTLANPVVAANNQVFPNTGGVTVRPLPDIENKLIKLALFAEYAVQKNADVRIDFIHERFKTDDWSWMFSNGTAFTYGTTTDGTTVTVVPKQISNFVGVRYIYKFQ
jgi:hypothetical protein